jgi:hypothetical protein
MGLRGQRQPKIESGIGETGNSFPLFPETVSRKQGIRKHKSEKVFRETRDSRETRIGKSEMVVS